MAWKTYSNSQQKKAAFYLSKGSIIINNSAAQELKLSANSIQRVTLRYDDENPNLIRFDFHKTNQPDSLKLIKVKYPYDPTKFNYRINCSQFFDIIEFKVHNQCRYKCTNFRREKDYVILDLNDKSETNETD